MRKTIIIFLNRFVCVGEAMLILALNCWLQVEQVNVVLVLALRSLSFLSASQILSFFIESCSFVDETSPL